MLIVEYLAFMKWFMFFLFKYQLVIKQPIVKRINKEYPTKIKFILRIFVNARTLRKSEIKSIGIECSKSLYPFLYNKTNEIIIIGTIDVNTPVDEKKERAMKGVWIIIFLFLIVSKLTINIKSTNDWIAKLPDVTFIYRQLKEANIVVIKNSDLMISLLFLNR